MFTNKGAYLKYFINFNCNYQVSSNIAFISLKKKAIGRIYENSHGYLLIVIKIAMNFIRLFKTCKVLCDIGKDIEVGRDKSQKYISECLNFINLSHLVIEIRKISATNILWISVKMNDI